jgi:hypothetical protein
MALTGTRGRTISRFGLYRSLRKRSEQAGHPVLWQLGIALSAVVVGAEAAKPSSLRLALALAGIVLAVGLASRAGPGLIYLVVIWTVVMGTVRRLLSGAAVANQTDPLLLVAVAALIVLTVAAAERGAFRNRTRLASAVLIFNVVTFFEAFNPLQGSIQTGVAGLAFLLVPVLAFWIGRGLCTDHVMTRILRLLGGLAIAAAIYGLIQTFASFPPWDSRWIASSGYTSLNVNKVIRAFGSFASAQEYALFLGVGILVWIGYGFRAGRAIWTLSACAVLGVALFYESSHTPLVTTIFAAGLVLAAVRARNPAVVLVVGIAAVALLPFVISQFTSGSADPYSGGLVGHQVTGLAHPFSSQDSTLTGHFGLVTHGFNIMLHHPLGTGASVVNIAGAKLGGVASNTEYDPSNVAIALGVPGLLAYIVIVVEAFRLALGRVRERKDVLSRAALGIIAVTVLEWTNGGLYAVAFLPWLMMGWLDRDASNDALATRSSEASLDATPDTGSRHELQPVV